jgi:hypothetical protein
MTKLSVSAVMLVASLTVVAAPATAHADPVPTVDDVVAVMAELTDPGIPAANKGNIVSPGFAPDEAGTIDDQLNRMNARGRILPLPFIVTDIQPAPNNFAGASWSLPFGPVLLPSPLVLVDQGGHWLITHDRAMVVLHSIWRSSFPKALGPRWE